MIIDKSGENDCAIIKFLVVKSPSRGKKLINRNETGVKNLDIDNNL